MIDKGLDMRINHLGSWNGQDLSWVNSSLFERRKALHGYEFDAVTVPSPPVTKLHLNGEQLRIGGYFGKVWHGLLEKHMNFSTRIRLNTDGKWGSRDENGSWNGMIEELHSKRAQLALSDFTITKARSEVVDFSPSLFEADMVMFVKIPGRESSWNTFI